MCFIYDLVTASPSSPAFHYNSLHTFCLICLFHSSLLHFFILLSVIFTFVIVISRTPYFHFHHFHTSPCQIFNFPKFLYSSYIPFLLFTYFQITMLPYCPRVLLSTSYSCNFLNFSVLLLPLSAISFVLL